MEMKVKGPKLHNRFDIVVTNVKTGEVELTGQAENIIVNRMYERLVGFGSYFSQIVFGTGAGTPNPTRNTLFNRIGNKACSTVELIQSFPISKWTQSIRLEAAEYNGNTLTEVGISETTTLINTHAMIVDAEGNPLSIEKTDVRIIDIYATVFVEFADISPGSWSSTIRDYLAGAGATPTNTLGIKTTKFLCRPTVNSGATAVTDSAAKTRKVSTRFNNYATLGVEASGNRYYGKTFKDRKLDIAVDLLSWSGVGDLPVTHESDMYYEYIVSAEEAEVNGLFLSFLDFEDITEVKINGNLVEDYTATEFGDFNYSSEEFSFLDVLSIPTHKMWQDLIGNHYHETGTVSSGTQQRGAAELHSEEGFNFVISFQVTQGYVYIYYDFSTKNNLEDPWVPYISNLGGGGNETTYRWVHINTKDKYLRVNCYIASGYGGMTVRNWQTYILPMMKFNTTVLQEGDIVLIKRHHVNEIPKGMNYLLDADSTITFGEGV